MKNERRIIAGNLTWLRAQRQVSLSELARRSGVGKATLSKLEAGEGNPTLETLWAIAEAFDVSLGSLLSEDGGARRVVRAADGGWVAGKVLDGRHIDRLLNPGFVDIYEIRVRPGTRHRRDGKGRDSIDHVFVISGRLLVGPEDSPVELAAGDLLRFASDAPYIFEALDDVATGLHILSSARAGDASESEAAALEASA